MGARLKHSLQNKRGSSGRKPRPFSTSKFPCLSPILKTEIRAQREKRGTREDLNERCNLPYQYHELQKNQRENQEVESDPGSGKFDPKKEASKTFKNSQFLPEIL